MLYLSEYHFPSRPQGNVLTIVDRMIHILKQAGIEMVIIKKWLGLRRKDNPAWFKLVKNLEENPDRPNMNWLDVI